MERDIHVWCFSLSALSSRHTCTDSTCTMKREMLRGIVKTGSDYSLLILEHKLHLYIAEIQPNHTHTDSQLTHTSSHTKITCATFKSFQADTADMLRLSWEWHKQSSSERNSGMRNWYVSKQRKAFISGSGSPEQAACLCAILIPWWHAVSTVGEDGGRDAVTDPWMYSLPREGTLTAVDTHTLCLETQRNEMKHAWCQLGPSWALVRLWAPTDPPSDDEGLITELQTELWPTYDSANIKCLFNETPTKVTESSWRLKSQQTHKEKLASHFCCSTCSTLVWSLLLYKQPPVNYTSPPPAPAFLQSAPFIRAGRAENEISYRGNEVFLFPWQSASAELFKVICVCEVWSQCSRVITDRIYYVCMWKPHNNGTVPAQSL